MSRIWEIREGYDPREVSYRHGKKKHMSEEYEEAYCEGYEDGFGDAMRKVEEEKYGSRMGYRNEGGSSYRGGSYSSRMGYREDDDEMEMGERRGSRRRDSRGRYM